MSIFGQKKSGETEITISNHTVFRVVILTILSLLFLAAVQQALRPLLLLFTAFFLALALNLPVQWIARRLPGKRKGNRTLATGLSFFIVVALLVGFMASIVPPLIKQTDSFIRIVPQLIDDTRDENSALGTFIRKYNLEQQTQKLSQDLSSRLTDIGGSAINTVNRATSSLLAVLTVLVLTFMMLIEGPSWGSLALKIIPENRHDHVKQLAKDMYKVITGFVNGQVTLAALAAIFITPMLFLFNVGYPLALMVIVFICGLIPLVGATIGAVIVGTVALFTSPLSALGIVIYYIAYQQIENYVLQPKIQANSTNMSPLLVFSSVLVGVSFGGLLGGLFAIPIAGCTRILLLDYLTRRKILTRAESDKVTTLAK